MIRQSLAGTIALALALALAGSARAQDQGQGGLHPTDGAPAGDQAPAAPAPAAPQGGVGADQAAPVPPPQVESAPRQQPADPGNWKGGPAGQAPAAPAPAANGADPLTSGAAPAAPAAPAKDPNVISNDDPRAGKIIDRNYSDAIKIYDQVLKNDGESVENLDHRIGSNESLVNNYKKKLADANEQKRRLQVELFNRTFYLKQQRDKGAIPDDVYEKLMKQEEKKYQDRASQVNSDCQFYSKEIQDADARLTTFRAERRVQVTTIQTNKAAAGGKKKPPMKQSERVVMSLKQRLQALSAFETKNPMDDAPVCEECLKPQGGGGSPGPMAGAPGDGPQVAPPADGAGGGS